MSCINEFLKQRKKILLTINCHCLYRMNHREVEEEKISEVVKTGKTNNQKCEKFYNKPYDKICLYRYFGKENETVEIILLYDKEFIQGEVMTVWKHQGRKTFRRKK